MGPPERVNKYLFLMWKSNGALRAPGLDGKTINKLFKF